MSLYCFTLQCLELICLPSTEQEFMADRINQTWINGSHKITVNNVATISAATYRVSCDDPLNSVIGLCKADHLKDKDSCRLCTFGDNGIYDMISYMLTCSLKVCCVR